MKKRGQVTIFIIIGLLILSICGIMFYLSKYSISNQLDSRKEIIIGVNTDPVKIFVEDCLNKVGTNSLLYLGKNGGYSDFQDNQLDWFFLDFQSQNNSGFNTVFSPYYFYDGKSRIPTLDFLEEEASKYVQLNLNSCLGNFSSFTKQGYHFENGSLSVNTSITNQKVVFKINFPLKISDNLSESHLADFEKNIYFTFKPKFDLIRAVVSEQEKYPNYIPLGFMTNLTFYHQFKYELISYQNEEIVQFNYLFNDSSLGQPFVYTYMVKYNWSEQKEEAKRLAQELKLFNYSSTNFTPSNNSLEYFNYSLVFSVFAPSVDYNKLPVDQLVSQLKGMSALDLATINNQNLVLALNKDTSLINTPEIKAEFEKRIQSDISLLNNNPSVKNSWLASYGLTCQNCKLDQFDGTNIITQKARIKFNPLDFKGAKILENGQIVFQNGPSSELTISEDSLSTKLSGTKTVLLEKTSEGIKVTSGVVQLFAQRFIRSDEPFLIKSSTDGLTISGKKVDYLLDLSGTTLSNAGFKLLSFSGEVRFNPDFEKNYHLTLKKGTQADFFSIQTISVPAFSVKTKNDLEYYGSIYGCSLESKSSCIDLTEGRLISSKDGEATKLNYRIFSREGNTIDFQIKNPNKDVEVAYIEDNSNVKLTYISNDGRFFGGYFSQGPSILAGDPSLLTANGLKVYGFCSGEKDTVCIQSFGSSSQACISKQSYQAAQQVKELREKHLALVKKQEVGIHYGSDWAKFASKEYSEKKKKLDLELNRILTVEIPTFEKELKYRENHRGESSPEMSGLDTTELQAYLDGYKKEALKLQLEINDLAVQYQIPTGAKSVSCLSYLREVMQQYPDAASRKAFLDNSKKSGVYGLDALEAQGWEMIAFAGDPQILSDSVSRRDDILQKGYALIKSESSPDWSKLSAEEKDAFFNSLNAEQQKKIMDTVKKDLAAYSSLNQLVSKSTSVYSGSGAEGSYSFKIDQVVSDFQVAKDYSIEKERLEILGRIPFGLITFKQGLHTAMLVSENGVPYIYEVHYSKGPGSTELYDRTPLKDYDWDGGIIGVEKGSWEKALKQFCSEKPSALSCLRINS